MKKGKEQREVLIAKSAGFCFGVRRAIRLARRTAKRAGKVYTLGPLIHNPQVVSALEQEGVIPSKRASDIDSGIVVIRSHGLPKDELARLREENLSWVDATCPYVKRVQEIVEKLSTEGYSVVVVGDKDHPEVRAIVSFFQPANKISVVASAKEASQLNIDGKLGLVAQTTQSWETFQQVFGLLVSKVRELRIFNTICPATGERQREARDLAKLVDCMVVVGGHNSANTARLVRLCQAIQPNTYRVETAAEVKDDWFVDCRKVGVTAGASTPKERVEEVVARIIS